MNRQLRYFLLSLPLFITIVLLNSCGDSSNSRVFGTSTKVVPSAENCKPGCFGIPQEWYELGLVIDINGNPINTPDPEVKKHGECFFRVCNDSSAYTLDAKEYINRFDGEIVFETDPIKCANLSTMTFQVNDTNQDNSIDFEKTSCQ